MSGKNNIVDKLREKLAIASQQGRRGVILQPGAIGDCILTLPLAELMKETVCPGGVDIIGHTEYLGMLSGRSCVDSVKSLDSMSLHRLFAGEGDFEVADGDPLIMAFAGYSWIASFLGEPGSHFEKNLIFTVNCSNSAEVITLAMKPAADSTNSPQAGSTPSTSSPQASSPVNGLQGQAGQASPPQANSPQDGHNIHISDFYRKQFVEQGGLSSQEHNSAIGMPLIRPVRADKLRGMEILAENGVMPTTKAIIMHPGSGGAHKCWHLDNFLAVARMLEKEGTDSVFLLGPAEQERFSQSAMDYIRALGKVLTDLPLSDVLAILSCSRGYLGNDSGITHLAAAVGIRTVAMFGPTDPAIYAPIGPAVTILRNDGPDFTEAVSETLQQQICKILLA